MEYGLDPRTDLERWMHTERLRDAAYPRQGRRGHPIDFLHQVMALAEHLAARGVLVPAALTDDELLTCDVDRSRYLTHMGPESVTKVTAAG